MAHTFENAFVVRAPADRVWAYLTDPYRVATALPGAAITGQTDDGAYTGTITVKVGPVSARYKGKLRFANLDEAARTAEIVASGQDMGGRGGADLRMTSRLAETSPGETEVAMTSSVNVTGILAQFGRGMIQDVSNQMFERFTQAVKAELEAPPAAAEAAVLEAGPAAAPAGELAAASGPAMPAPAAPAPAPKQAPPIEVVSFGGQIAGRAALRLLSRPAFWIVLALLIALFWWWMR